MKRGTGGSGRESDLKKQHKGCATNDATKTCTIRDIVSLQTLSSDILTQIASHLTPADLVVSSKVCRVWCFLFSNDRVWKGVCGEDVKKFAVATPSSQRFLYKQFLQATKNNVLLQLQAKTEPNQQNVCRNLILFTHHSSC